MDAYEYGELLKSLSTKMENITNIVKPDELRARLDEIERMQQNPEFWSDNERAAKVAQEKTRLERTLNKYDEARDALSDAQEYFELAKSEGDEETLEMLYEDAENLKEHIQQLEIAIMLSGEHDSANAIVTIHPGGLEAYEYDIAIPAKYGVGQCIGDTLGPGGVFRGLRTIPVLLDICRDMDKVCSPEALLINYSNPMAINCWGVATGSGRPHVGLCHSVQSTAEVLAGFIGAPLEEISYWVAGINHQAWFLEFRWNGRDAYPLLRERIRDPQIIGQEPIPHGKIAYPVLDPFHHLQRKTDPVFNAAAVGIVSQVGPGRHKLGQEVSGAAVEFHQVEPCLLHPRCGLRILVLDGNDFLLGQRSRGFPIDRNGRGCNPLIAKGKTPGMIDLKTCPGLFTLDALRKFRESRQISVMVHTNCAWRSAPLSCDAGILNHDHGSAASGHLAVMMKQEG